jgi:hypothetical protein
VEVGLFILLIAFSWALLSVIAALAVGGVAKARDARAKRVDLTLPDPAQRERLLDLRRAEPDFAEHTAARAHDEPTIELRAVLEDYAGDPATLENHLAGGIETQVARTMEKINERLDTLIQLQQQTNTLLSQALTPRS